MCSIDAPAESGGVIVLWSIVWDRYACIQSYMGLCSYVHKTVQVVGPYLQGKRDWKGK